MRNSELDNLKSFLTQLRDEDLIWALYVGFVAQIDER